MLKTGSKAWALGLDEVMKQINYSPHESLPVGVTPNIVMFGWKRKLEIREPPNERGNIMIITEDLIDRVYSINEPNLNEPDIGAVELALEYSIQKKEVPTSATVEPAQEFDQRLAGSLSSQLLLLPNILSTKGKERAAEEDKNKNTEDHEHEQDHENKDQEEDM